jgi:hypothetical protein
MWFVQYQQTEKLTHSHVVCTIPTEGEADSQPRGLHNTNRGRSWLTATWSAQYQQREKLTHSHVVCAIPTEGEADSQPRGLHNTNRGRSWLTATWSAQYQQREKLTHSHVIYTIPTQRWKLICSHVASCWSSKISDCQNNGITRGNPRGDHGRSKLWTQRLYHIFLTCDIQLL